MKKLTLTLAALATLTLAACGHRRHEAMDPARLDDRVTDHLEDLLDDLDATPAQRAQAKAIKDRLVPSTATFLSGQKQARREVVAQLTADRADAARLHALVDQRIEAARALAHQAVDAAVELQATLTPEQRARVAKKVQRFAGR